MRIQRKWGLPFWLYQIKLQKFFYAGVLIFFVLLFALSSFVWRVDIKGINQVPEDVVRTILKQEGVYQGQLKAKLPDTERLKERLLARIPESSWVGLQVSGTRILVTIVEKKQVEKMQDELPSYGPVHLVAKKGAMITDLNVEKGNPLVGVNDVVEKGETLVSGIYGESTEPSAEKKSPAPSRKVVGAKGKVYGEVWYDAEIEVPLLQQKKVLTGVRDKSSLPYIGKWIMRMPFQQPAFTKFERVQHVKPVRFGTWQLPIGWIDEEYFQMKHMNVRLPTQTASKLGIQQAKAELQRTLGEDGKILTQKVLHQRVENGKVYLKIHFDVVENIAVPKPILQGE